MGIFASNGSTEQTLPADIGAVRTAIVEFCREQGHHLAAVSQDELRFEAVTTRTLTNWGTAIVITLEPTGSGTRARFDYDNVPGSPSALLDGRKNSKTATKFIEGLTATLR